MFTRILIPTLLLKGLFIAWGAHLGTDLMEQLNGPVIDPNGRSVC